MTFGIKFKNKGKASKRLSKQEVYDMRRRLGLAGINYLESQVPPHHLMMASPVPEENFHAEPIAKPLSHGNVTIYAAKYAAILH